MEETLRLYPSQHQPGDIPDMWSTRVIERVERLSPTSVRWHFTDGTSAHPMIDGTTVRLRRPTGGHVPSALVKGD